MSNGAKRARAGRARGKVAIDTAASAGIGRAIARPGAREGARGAVNGRADDPADDVAFPFAGEVEDHDVDAFEEHSHDVLRNEDYSSAP